MTNTKMPWSLRIAIAAIVILFGFVTYSAWEFNKKVLEVSNKIDTMGYKVRQIDSLDRIEYEKMFLPGGNIAGDSDVLYQNVNDSTVLWSDVIVRPSWVHSTPKNKSW